MIGIFVPFTRFVFNIESLIFYYIFVFIIARFFELIDRKDKGIKFSGESLWRGKANGVEARRGAFPS